MKNIYICYASSDLFAEPTGVSMVSLFENNKDIPITKVFLLDYGLTINSKNLFKNLSSQYNIPIEFVRSKEIIESKRDELGLSDFCGSMATYSRAFIDLIIPSYVDELVYIDSDTIVDGSIADLVRMDMSESVMSGIIGINQYPYKGEPVNTEINLINGNTNYYACGVVRYSLNNWRKNNCLQMICRTAQTLKDLPYADQTLINNAIPEAFIKPMHPKFNSWLHELPSCCAEYELRRGNKLSDTVIEEAIKNPIIHHYKGSLYRPWFIESLSRANEVFYKYKALSPWKDFPLKHMDDLLSSNPKTVALKKMELRSLAPRMKIKNTTLLKVYDLLAINYRRIVRCYLNFKYCES